MLGWLFKSKNAKSEKPAKKPPQVKGVSNWVEGIVKSYAPKKKFGFISADRKDVFVHQSVFPKGVNTLVYGQKVQVKYGMAEKGPMVVELRLA